MSNYLIRLLAFQPCVTWPAHRPSTRAAILRGENAPQCIKLPYKNAIPSCVSLIESICYLHSSSHNCTGITKLVDTLKFSPVE